LPGKLGGAMEMGTVITVIKLTPQYEETWRYQGTVLFNDGNQMIIEAFFDREDREFHGLFLGKGDRFVELYFREEWFNIFEIHDRVDDHLKGWYCNVTLPAEFNGNIIRYIDLALDLLVFPDGRQLVLDEKEFEELIIEPDTRKTARESLKKLQQLFSNPGKFQIDPFKR
jgi:uncharacterized protein